MLPAVGVMAPARAPTCRAPCRLSRAALAGNGSRGLGWLRYAHRALRIARAACPGTAPEQGISGADQVREGGLL